jgi:hypothetical protein
MMLNRTVRIGAGCSVDVTLALPQMVRQGNVDYIVIDFMYEGSVAAMASARLGDAEGGFAADFLGPELEQELRQILQSGIKVITNAGGLNPAGCAAALTAMAGRLGLKPRIAVVDGDNVLDQVRQAAGAYRDMYTGEPLPDNLIGANAYLGAKPIAVALEKGADIVITGRVVDSALTLGPLIHEFGWEMTDYRRLGAGTLIGHLLECGAHPTGGIFTDWRDVDWTETSFPIAECQADGTAIITKPKGTGGLVSIGTISEQILYEIGDPQRYHMADVTCDLSSARLEQFETDQIRIVDGNGYPPTSTYKVCAIAQEGWRGVVSGVVSGPAAREKAEKTAAAVLERTRRLLRDHNLGEFTSTGVELIGSGASNGMRAPDQDAREMVYRIVADHQERQAVETMLRVSKAALASMGPGTASPLGSSVSPKLRQYSFLMEKEKVRARVTFEGSTETIDVATDGGFDPATLPGVAAIKPERAAGEATVPLVRLAWARSGDKGDISNIGVIARKPEYLPYLSAALTEDAVAKWYAHVFASPDSARVKRYDLPRLNAINLMLYGALDGGVVSSRRFDTMGKGMGQQIIDFPVPVPAALLQGLEKV